jgi:molybdopterin synthase sulfur carrier subunit
MSAEPVVTVHLTAPLRPYCGGVARLEVAAASVQAVLRQLERSEAPLHRNLCDETGAVRRHLNVFVNATNVRDLAGVDTALKAGDVVTFLPAVSGG